MVTDVAELQAPQVEVQKEMVYDVFIYDPGFGTIHRLDVKESPDTEFVPLSISEDLGPNDILSVKRIESDAFYVPVLEEEEIAKATGYLNKSGIDHEETPLFVKFISPAQKEDLVEKGYNIVRPEPVKTA